MSRLTEPGRIFLEQARQILAKADEARSQVVAAAAGYSGQLRLAYTVSVSFHPALPQTCCVIGQIAPNVRLQLSEMYTEPQFAALLADEIDVGFVRNEPIHAQDARNLRLSVIDREPLLLALPAGHPLASRSSLRLAEVAGDAFVSQPRELAATLYDRLVTLAPRPASSRRSSSTRSRSTACWRWSPRAWDWPWCRPACARCAWPESAMSPLEDSDAYMLLAIACRADDHSPALQQFLATVAETAVAPGL